MAVCVAASPAIALSCITVIMRSTVSRTKCSFRICAAVPTLPKFLSRNSRTRVHSPSASFALSRLSRIWKPSSSCQHQIGAPVYPSSAHTVSSSTTLDALDVDEHGGDCTDSEGRLGASSTIHIRVRGAPAFTVPQRHPTVQPHTSFYLHRRLRRRASRAQGRRIARGRR